MTDQEKPAQLFALVDVSSTENASFLKRASLKDILVWQKYFVAEGKAVKRLDLIHDLETLQYLFWNTTQTAPADTIEALVSACAELANQVPVDDTTSMEELLNQLPANGGSADVTNLEEGETVTMGQGAKTEGTLEKGSAKKKTSAKKPAADAAETTKPAAEAKPKKEKDPTGRPSEGTATRKVWDIADKLAEAQGHTPTRGDVIDASVKAGVNKATAGVQYGAWMKGMKRDPAPKPVKEVEAAEETETEDNEEGEEE